MPQLRLLIQALSAALLGLVSHAIDPSRSGGLILLEYAPPSCNKVGMGSAALRMLKAVGEKGGHAFEVEAGNHAVWLAVRFRQC